MNKNWKTVIAAANLAALSLGGVVGCKKSETNNVETQMPAEATTEGGCATGGCGTAGGCGGCAAGGCGGCGVAE